MEMLTLIYSITFYSAVISIIIIIIITLVDLQSLIWELGCTGCV